MVVSVLRVSPEGVEQSGGQIAGACTDLAGSSNSATPLDIAPGQLYTHYLFQFTNSTASAIDARVFFQNSGTDNNGAVLGGFELTSTVVPLPAAGWLLLTGIGGVAALQLRRHASSPHRRVHRRPDGPPG